MGTVFPSKWRFWMDVILHSSMQNLGQFPNDWDSTTHGGNWRESFLPNYSQPERDSIEGPSTHPPIHTAPTPTRLGFRWPSQDVFTSSYPCPLSTMRSWPHILQGEICVTIISSSDEPQNAMRGVCLKSGIHPSCILRGTDMEVS